MTGMLHCKADFYYYSTLISHRIGYYSFKVGFFEKPIEVVFEISEIRLMWLYCKKYQLHF